MDLLKYELLVPEAVLSNLRFAGGGTKFTTGKIPNRGNQGCNSLIVSKISLWSIGLQKTYTRRDLQLHNNLELKQKAKQTKAWTNLEDI